MPKLSIPLRSGEPDILLDLQALLDLSYVNGGYHGAIDYNKPLRNPLPPEIACLDRNVAQSERQSRIELVIPN